MTPWPPSGRCAASMPSPPRMPTTVTATLPPEAAVTPSVSASVRSILIVTTWYGTAESTVCVPYASSTVSSQNAPSSWFHRVGEMLTTVPVTISGALATLVASGRSL
ncbi:MAG: hypothetical protein U0470_09725 [Anaerolineae bacterium]